MSLIVRSSAAAALLLAAAACASTSSGRTSSAPVAGSAAVTTSAADGTVRIRATDQFRFTPSTIETHPGDLTVTLMADGDYPHNFSVAKLHATSKTVGGGLGPTTTSLTLHLTRPGTYTFECTYHSSAGMRGTIVVK